jgi:hypothetical protein
MRISSIRTGIKQTYVVYHNSLVFACGSNKNKEVRDSDNKIEYELGLMFEKNKIPHSVALYKGIKLLILDVMPTLKGVII